MICVYNLKGNMIFKRSLKNKPIKSINFNNNMNKQKDKMKNREKKYNYIKSNNKWKEIKNSLTIMRLQKFQRDTF